MHAFTVKQVEGTITAEEPLRYTHKLIFKQDLKEIRECRLLTEREGLMHADGKTPFPNSLDPPLSVFKRHF